MDISFTNLGIIATGESPKNFSVYGYGHAIIIVAEYISMQWPALLDYKQHKMLYWLLTCNYSGEPQGVLILVSKGSM